MGKRVINRLSALAVSRVKEAGMYADGGGLYLRVSADGGRSWVLRYMLGGRAREMGLGALANVSLADARKKAQHARSIKTEGIDPIAAKAGQRAKAAAERAKLVTFRDAAQIYIRTHKANWRNAKHGDQWESTLATYAYPTIGNLPVGEIDTPLVLKVLQQKIEGKPFSEARPETASRVRGRIEAILDWAKVHGYRSGDNPARWRGHLAILVSLPSKTRRVKHHPALPYTQINGFITQLRKQDGLAASALELLILTAARTGEIVGARWEEIDLQARLWTIPAHRIKAGKEHRIPLSPRAVAILEGLREIRLSTPDGEPSPWVFPGVRTKPLSNGAILALLKRMKRKDVTGHGFRSTFRDWAAEQTAFPRDVAEMALAHTIGDKVEAAYRRGDLFEKRKRLMEAWAAYVEIVQADTGGIVPLRRRKA